MTHKGSLLYDIFDKCQNRNSSITVVRVYTCPTYIELRIFSESLHELYFIVEDYTFSFACLAQLTALSPAFEASSDTYSHSMMQYN